MLGQVEACKRRCALHCVGCPPVGDSILECVFRHAAELRPSYPTARSIFRHPAFLTCKC